MQLTHHHNADAMHTLSLSESLERYSRSLLGWPVEESQEGTDIEREATRQSSDKEHGLGMGVTAAMEELEQQQHQKCHANKHLAAPQIAAISESSYLSCEESCLKHRRD